MGIGKKLEELLNERNMTVAQLAKQTEIPASTIYSIIQRNNRKVDIDVLLDISEFLGVDAEYFSDKHNKKSIEEYEPTYEEISSLVARNGKKLTDKERNELIRIILSED